MLPSSRRIPKTLAEDVMRGKQSSLRHSPNFSVRYIFTKRLEKSRFGVVVSKKMAKTAVERNRIRRKVYASLRKLVPAFKPGLVGFIFPKASSKELSFSALNQEVSALLQDIGVIQKRG